MTEEPAWGVRRGEKGINALGKMEGERRARVVLVEPQVDPRDEPTMDDLRRALVAVYGTDFGARRVYALLHAARPVFISLGEPGALDIKPWGDRVQGVDARYAGAWELPVLGSVPAPCAVLIRPDGHVAWVGEGTDQGLRDALTRWFGPPHVM